MLKWTLAVLTITTLSLPQKCPMDNLSDGSVECHLVNPENLMMQLSSNFTANNVNADCDDCDGGGLDPCLANVSNLVRPLVNLPACAPTPHHTPNLTTPAACAPTPHHQHPHQAIQPQRHTLSVFPSLFLPQSINLQSISLTANI